MHMDELELRVSRKVFGERITQLTIDSFGHTPCTKASLRELQLLDELLSDDYGTRHAERSKSITPEQAAWANRVYGKCLAAWEVKYAERQRRN